jgi:hypothetical protein
MEPVGGPTEADRNLGRVREAARAAAQFIHPVFETAEGNGRRKHIASSLILREGRRAAFVTAAHAVRGPSRKTVVLSTRGQIQNWPAEYAELQPVADGIGLADVAFVTGTITGETEEPRMFTLDQVAVDLDVRPDMSFVTIGYPASRTRIIDGNQALSPATFITISSPAPDAALLASGFDPRVHIAARYDQHEMRAPDGEPMEGPRLKGMSGGGLFVLAGVERDNEVVLSLLLAGVLIQHRGPPENLLVATRLDCVLDAVSPRRPAAARTHRVSQTRG